MLIFAGGFARFPSISAEPSLTMLLSTVAQVEEQRAFLNDLGLPVRFAPYAGRHLALRRERTSSKRTLRRSTANRALPNAFQVMKDEFEIVRIFILRSCGDRDIV